MVDPFVQLNTKQSIANFVFKKSIANFVKRCPHVDLDLSYKKEKIKKENVVLYKYFMVIFFFTYSGQHFFWKKVFIL